LLCHNDNSLPEYCRRVGRLLEYGGAERHRDEQCSCAASAAAAAAGVDNASSDDDGLMAAWLAVMQCCSATTGYYLSFQAADLSHK